MIHLISRLIQCSSILFINYCLNSFTVYKYKIYEKFLDTLMNQIMFMSIIYGSTLLQFSTPIIISVTYYFTFHLNIYPLYVTYTNENVCFSNPSASKLYKLIEYWLTLCVCVCVDLIGNLLKHCTISELRFTYKCVVVVNVPMIDSCSR